MPPTSKSWPRRQVDGTTSLCQGVGFAPLEGLTECAHVFAAESLLKPFRRAAYALRYDLGSPTFC
ncbi:hypothetical protein FOXG_21476 [Fusarium oxysporum f. sp. lycopersici 4287]|uniref:Uncharacterized protein n=1 Tax=Fusarium oxysporum f. sp. lycopersici (strain 4287 / CBS 123668 / FGSC 9935 / NRRL 34936) TaxID=426428 RepID=A0A0J9VZ54_FUSO4|nr:hypothetical protein FOXG_21476 [Fusarium oxysporum f. sp. lycopersici 4287]KNB15775.1 hypothetical protein FOXG_21476 [Fusarium oxysporum f. sp. lycopersici 4287]